ncbi:hypothetical protein AWB96_15615 [Mycobacteroides chelonae]|nr:hypothetical protein GR01_07780 [Mycobacteroides chelonae]ANB00877.1 hypothetical protein BB28_08260 [Mycobacteroides chelonae CCUG 47445]OLT75155.1 hypothetical protein BKG56_15375 [Mycobacteroides chelonae]ORV12803.1 hypothetical protein AWB96_15615 [Mycobacteroides chelonae]
MADALVVERLAEIAAARDGSLILPGIRVGALHAFREWPHIRIDSSLLIEQVIAYAAPARAYGNRLLLLNGHDENHEPLMVAARTLSSEFGTDVVVVEWAQLVTDVIRNNSTSTSESHAGEALTSLLLHWYPEHVVKERISAGAMPAGGVLADDLHVEILAHNPQSYTRDEVPTGVLGDPRPASAQKGALIADALVERIGLLVNERRWQ